MRLRRPVVVRKAVELRPVAGGEKGCLREHPFGARAGQDTVHLAFVVGDELSHFARCRAVVEADDNEIHSETPINPRISRVDGAIMDRGQASLVAHGF